MIEKVTVGLNATGDDTIWTGAGADHVYYETGDGVDRIADFEVGADTLHIGGYALGDLQIERFNGDMFIRFKDASADGFVDDAMIELTDVASFDPALIVFTVPEWV